MDTKLSTIVEGEDHGRNTKEVQQIRAARQKQMEMMQKIEMAQGAAAAGKDATQADKNLAEVAEIGA